MRKSAVAVRLQKMMIDFGRLRSVRRNMWRKCSRKATLTCSIICLREAGIASFCVSTSQTKTGGFPPVRGSSFSARTSGVTVAVKRRVWRSEAGGRTDRHSSTSGSILPTLPLANNRSASSSTTIRTRRRAHIVSSPEVRIWSASLPGVAITTCGLWARAVACVRISEPPVTRTAFND